MTNTMMTTMSEFYFEAIFNPPQFIFIIGFVYSNYFCNSIIFYLFYDYYYFCCFFVGGDGLNAILFFKVPFFEPVGFNPVCVF